MSCIGDMRITLSRNFLQHIYFDIFTHFFSGPLLTERIFSENMNVLQHLNHARRESREADCIAAET